MIRLVLFLTVLHIFNDEFVNSTFRNKKRPDQKAEQKLNFNINLGEIQYMGASS